MSQDNLFDGFDWQPSGNYGKFDDGNVIEAKRTFSRFSLALFTFVIVANISAFLASLIMLLAMGAEKYALFLDSNPIIEMLLSTLPMYLFALPALYLIVKDMPGRRREKRKLPLLELFYTFLVAEAFMTAGNLLGQTLSTSIGSVFGIEVSNSTADLIMRTPIWLIFILVVIAAPIIEEFIFRKLMIDKLSRFGDTVAIITSAVAFGLFHGNFYQFFYAAFLGLLLGYVYCKSGNIKYSIVFHMLINFLGSVVVIPLVKYEEILLSGTIPETAEALREYIIASIMLGSYTILQYAMVIAGIVIFINAIKNKKIFINPSAELRIPEGKRASAIVGNAGAILFLTISLLSFAASIFLG